MQKTSDREIRQPGLIVTYLEPGDYDPELSDSGVISVVRSLSVPLPEGHAASVMVDGLDLIFRRVDGGAEISLYRAAG